MDDDVEARERVFHNAVREYIVRNRKCLLLLLLMYVSTTSYAALDEPHRVYANPVYSI